MERREEKEDGGTEAVRLMENARDGPKVGQTEVRRQIMAKSRFTTPCPHLRVLMF